VGADHCAVADFDPMTEGCTEFVDSRRIPLDSMHRMIEPPDNAVLSNRVVNKGNGEWVAICLATPGCVQRQIARWSQPIDAIGRKFEYNLRPFPPTLQNRFGSILAIFAGSDEACERGKEARIANQQ